MYHFYMCKTQNVKILIAQSVLSRKLIALEINNSLYQKKKKVPELRKDLELESIRL